jgi:hypothetical protein
MQGNRSNISAFYLSCVFPRRSSRTSPPWCAQHDQGVTLPPPAWRPFHFQRERRRCCLCTNENRHTATRCDTLITA